MKLIKVEGVPVNKKLYDQFMKTLKGFEITQSRNYGQVDIEYNNGVTKGKISLLGQRTD